MDRKFISEEEIKIEEFHCAITEDLTFIFYAKDEVNRILSLKDKKKIDYYLFYVYLHFCLEISISFMFRHLVRFHVYLKTQLKDLDDKTMDKMGMDEKIDTLIYFIDQNRINKLNGSYSNFAEKRNKILHGYWIGCKHENSDTQDSKINSWENENELLSHLEVYRNIILDFQNIIDELPVKDQGKKDLKGMLVEL